MRKSLIAAAVILGAASLVVTAERVGASNATRKAEAATAQKKAAAPQSHAARVARGQYLVTIGGCNDCHTPWVMGKNGPEPDMSRALSGHPEKIVMPPPPDLGDGGWEWIGSSSNTAFAGPWGISYARNLTPEPLTGIGIWTEEMFIQTLRSGKHWGVSRPILPPMPWFNYGKATDEDLKSIYAYLRTLKPVKNQVPDAVLAPPPTAVASR